MSCDYLAKHAIASLGACLSAPERTYLQAVYDQPTELRPGEDRAALSRAAQALVLRLRAQRAAVPDHLDVRDQISRSSVRFGRLALALSELEQRQRQPQAGEPPAPNWGAWMRVALMEPQPSRALRALQESGRLAEYPHLAALPGCEQDTYWHPEGDAWDHTLAVADEAARIAERDGLSAEDRMVLVLGSVAHDFAKPETTTVRWETAPAGPEGAPPEPGRGPAWEPDGEGGYKRRRVNSYGHEEKGEPLAEAWLRQIGAPEAVIAQVKPLVRLHMRHLKPYWKHGDIAKARAAGADTAALQREFDQLVLTLAEEVKPASLAQFDRLIEADHGGREPRPKERPAACIVERARELGLEPPASGPSEHCPRCGRFMGPDGAHPCPTQEALDGWAAELRSAARGGPLGTPLAHTLRLTATDLLGSPQPDPALAQAAARVRDEGGEEALRGLAAVLTDVRQRTRPERGLLDTLGWARAASRYEVSYVEVEPQADGSTVARVAVADGEGFEELYDGYEARGNDEGMMTLEQGVLALVDDHPALIRLAQGGRPPSVAVEDGAVVLTFPPPRPGDGARPTPRPMVPLRPPPPPDGPMLPSYSAQVLAPTAAQALAVLARPEAAGTRTTGGPQALAVAGALNGQVRAAEALAQDEAAPPEVRVRAADLLDADAAGSYTSDETFGRSIGAAVALAEATSAAPRLTLSPQRGDDPAAWVAAAPDVVEVARGADASPLSVDLLGRTARVWVDQARDEIPDARVRERDGAYQAAVAMLQHQNQGAAEPWAQQLVSQATAAPSAAGQSFAVQMAGVKDQPPALSPKVRLGLAMLVGSGVAQASPLHAEQIGGVARMAAWVAGQEERPAFLDYLGATTRLPSPAEVAAAAAHLDEQMAEARRMALQKHRSEAGLARQEQLPLEGRSPEARYLAVTTRYRDALRWLVEGGGYPAWMPPLPDWPGKAS